MPQRCVPARVGFAIDTLGLEPHHRVLEFGCGTGLAATLVAERLTVAGVTAIDRSPRAIARAVERGTDVGFHNVELADFTSDTRFDRVFGINVNLFWTSRCDGECAAVRSLLAADGLLVLVYETPGDVRAEIVERSVASLDVAGFRTEIVKGAEPALVAIRAALRGASVPAGDHVAALAANQLAHADASRSAMDRASSPYR